MTRVFAVFTSTSPSGDPPRIPHLISTHQASGDCTLSGLSKLTWNLEEIDNLNISRIYLLAFISASLLSSRVHKLKIVIKFFISDAQVAIDCE